ncbi:urea ABC transporter permease subunit UrtB [Haloferula chungangensis]|uniref:Urea ABC transporter permease subunit UrtB n=1 Tax=Haloferula chungangensis TaxID=1048331 RepID=A0ABW2LDQ5_9BACT
MKRIFLTLLSLLLVWSHANAQDDQEVTPPTSAREVLSNLILENGEEDAILEQLSEFGDPIIQEVVAAWRIGKIQIAKEGESSIALIERDDALYELLTDSPYTGDVSGAEKSRASRSLRKKLSRLVDVIDLVSPDLNVRADAALKLGSSQSPDYLPALKANLPKQKNSKTREAFEEGIQISLLANGTVAEKITSLEGLTESPSVYARSFIEKLAADLEGDTSEDAAILRSKAQAALKATASHEKKIENFGTLFRGLSTGSVLLIVAYGLAITFGLMGIINMAHGEFIAIGGYTVFVVQNWFASTYGVGTAVYESYFLWAIPIAFLTAAFFGALLEIGVIRFLYKRPLESLLATWGISMLIRQGLRMKFGSTNVMVDAPQWLSGNVSIGDVTMPYARLFVIGFAVVVVFITWFILRRTKIGLHIRATMQNRQMASSLGIPAKRVNLFTFAFGSGLAGLAGAFLSQIGNVGPEMGQTYIVDSFMVVVIGGVGNLLGAAISSMGIGMFDQGLQPILGPVLGKVLVLIAIILFLQWRPGGLFPSRSRSLDD